jgi:hypothetical protein
MMVAELFSMLRSLLVLVLVFVQSKARQIAERRERVAELKRMRAQSENASASENAAAVSPDGQPVTGPTVVSVLIKADGVGTLEALQKIVLGLGSRTKDVVLQVLWALVIADQAIMQLTYEQYWFIGGGRIGGRCHSHRCRARIYRRQRNHIRIQYRNR